MSDVNANIDINIDSSNALAQLKSLQRQIAQFHTSIARSSESAALAQRGLQKNLLNSINAISGFTAEMRTVKTSAESFTNSLEKNKFSMREYFRYAGASTKTFGRLFKSEFDTIGKVSEERVKKLQTQYIKMGRDANGAMQAMAIMPTKLNMSDYGTQVQLAAQKQALFNQLMKQGSTNLLNFGKNTQWAGRQLMVGFTLPLMAVGTAASKTFMEMEAQAIKFKKVYGDLFTPQEETEEALTNITNLGREFTKYGIAVSTTVGLAAEAAAAGFSGLDLQRQTTEATRLSILGQLDSQKALETTISLQNAFGMSSEKLAESIDFLNAVENQTVVSLDDITTAIPKVAPVIQQLGGDVKDLTFFMAAMKEGGINASEGANALKSGLGSLINPGGKASAMLKSFGINAEEIVTKNKGNLKATVIEFAEALNQLDPLNRAQVIEQMFGKFQFARLSTLFANVAKDGNQASRVLNLANSSVEELSALSEKELGMTAESSMNKFKKAIEDLKFALIPVGQAFLEAATPIVEFVSNILEKFANLSDGTKKVITLLTVGIGAVGPVLLMTFGLLANGVANIIKLFLTLRGGYQRLTGQSQILGEQTQYMTMEQLDAAAAAHSLNQTHATLTQTFTAEANAIKQLVAAYSSAAAASVNFARSNPGMMMPGRAKGYADGVISVPGPKGAGDIIPAMLSPGEAVVPADMAKKYAPLIQGMIAGNIPGFMSGTVSVGASATQLDFARKDTAIKVQKLIDGLLQNGSGIENASQIIEETLQRLAEDTKIGIGNFVRELDIVTQQLSGKQIPGSVLAGAGRGERKFNANQTGVGTMADQAVGNPVLIEELRRAKESSAVAQQAMKDYYTSVGKDASEFSGVVKQAGDVHRAHVIDIRNNVDKMFMEAWDPDAWIAQSSTLNQVSNILQSSESTRDEYFNQLSEVNADESVIATIRDKITNNLALTEAELVVQKQVLERILSSTSSMSKVAAGFGPQAAGAVAATDYLMQNPATQQGVGSRTPQQISQAQAKLNNAKFRGQQTFVPVTQAARDVVDETVLATARAAGTQSPSKRTIPIGEDIARGLEVGMANRVDDVAKSGQQLGSAATGGAKSGARKVSAPQGSPLSRGIAISDPALLSMAYQENTMRDKLKTQAKNTDVMNQRMDKLNKGLMGGTFALMSLASAGSMASGPLGNLSQQVMKYSGLLFGLMTVTQLLTQTKIAELAATRASTVANLMGGTGVKSLFTKGGGFAGFGKNLLTAGKFALRFAGPVGIATTAVLGVASALKFYQKKQEEARLRIEGLGDAALLTSGKIKTLEDFFGKTATKSGFESSGPKVAVSKEQRTKIDDLRETEAFQKDFGKDIDALSSATSKQAEIIFKTLQVQLKGKGFVDEEIKTIIQALQEEAGKTNVVIDFKSFDLTTEVGQKQLSNIALGLGKSFGKSFTEGYSETTETQQDLMGEDFTVTVVKMSDAFKKSLSTTSKVFAGLFDGLSGQMENGIINAKQFDQSFSSIVTTIKGFPEPAAILMLDQIFSNLPGDLAKTATGFKNIATQLLVLEALSFGLLTAELIESLKVLEASTNSYDKQELTRVKNNIANQIANAKVTKDKIADIEKEAAARAAAAAGEGKENPIKKRIKDIQQQTKAYIILRNANVDNATATELSNDAEIAALVIANGKGKKLKDLVKLVNQYKKAIKEQTKAAEENMSEEERFKSNITRTLAIANLREKLIDIQYASQLKKENDQLASQEKALQDVNDQIDAITKKDIDPLQKQIAANNFALEGIALREDAINEKYEKQISALEKIETLNQDISNTQKQRLTIADALTRGDISAAAAAMQDARAQSAESALSGQKNALTAGRDAAIGALGRTELEKQNKQLQYEISVIENGRLLTLQNQKETIEDQISATQRAITKIELQVETLKNTALYAGQTKKALEDQDELIGLAEAAGIKYNAELIKQLANAQGIQKAIEALDTEVTTIHTIITKNVSSGGGGGGGEEKPKTDTKPNTKPEAKPETKTEEKPKAPVKPPVTAREAERKTPLSNINFDSIIKQDQAMANRNPIKRAFGGFVPKYFAKGGMAIGSDTIPAMLTPGEFIVNRSAASAYGPMLKTLNESKYPSMLGQDLSPIVPIVNNSTSLSDNSTAVYNYTLGFNINGSTSNPNDIARAVIKEIKQIDSQRIRGSRR
jgi:TP901 family phage tail tape measure protein